MKKEVLLTQHGLDKLKEELTQLKVRRKGVVERIRLAREFGDLSENSEYEDARNDQSFVEGRIEEVQDIITRAKIVKKAVSGDIIEMGSTVTLSLDGEKFSYEIVGANESDPMNGKISSESPLGFSLLGKNKGEMVEITTPNGKTVYKVIDVK